MFQIQTPVTSFPSGGYTSLDITDTYSISGQGALTSFTNTFRQTYVGVPGPLPVVGVMAALGWSRRMRRRLHPRRRSKHLDNQSTPRGWARIGWGATMAP
jgi:hypothetical protein